MTAPSGAPNAGGPRRPTRTFIALNLPEAERMALHAAAHAVRAAAGSAAWVAPANLHLTLKFLGDVGDDRIEAVAAALRRVAAAHRPVVLDVGGAGVFPNLRAPRIVWIGVAPDARLELLHHDVERACEDLGFPVEGRAFRPHVTLGRVREALGAAERRALKEALRALSVVRRIHVGTVDLMASAPGSGGSRYTVLTEAPLGAGEVR